MPELISGVYSPNLDVKTNFTPNFCRQNSLSRRNTLPYNSKQNNDNTLKYAVGIGSLLALAGLAIAGYPGKLGKIFKNGLVVMKW